MRFTKPQAKVLSEDALIPLINVVFLMLIFFMITGQISPPDALNVEPPSSRQGQLTEPEPVILSMDAAGRVALNAEVVPAAELTERLTEALAAQREATPAITLKADAAVTQAQLRVLLDRLRALGVERVQLLSRQVDL
jgi:biopolymer transport protein ExbD